MNTPFMNGDTLLAPLNLCMAHLTFLQVTAVGTATVLAHTPLSGKAILVKPLLLVHTVPQLTLLHAKCRGRVGRLLAKCRNTSYPSSRRKVLVRFRRMRIAIPFGPVSLLKVLVVM